MVDDPRIELELELDATALGAADVRLDVGRAGRQ